MRCGEGWVAGCATQAKESHELFYGARLKVVYFILIQTHSGNPNSYHYSQEGLIQI